MTAFRSSVLGFKPHADFPSCSCPLRASHQVVARTRPVFVLWLLLVCLLPAGLSGCNRAPVTPPLLKLQGGTMGTFYEVTVSHLPEVESAALQEQIESELTEINQQMSTYLPESEISRFNRSEQTDWFSVSAEFAEVVDAALQVATLTDGAFDPTVGPLVNAWHFGPGKGELTPPTTSELAELLPLVGYQKLEVRLDPPALKKSAAAVQLDLSGIAKGYAVDRVSQLVEQAGWADHLVNIGGEIRARGLRPDGQPWRLAVEKPTPEKREIQQIIELENTSLATSGDYRNYYEVDGMRYSHTIDPQTGQPVRHQLHSVTIRAETCMWADALATALMVQGPDRAWEFAQTHDYEVFLIFSQDGKLETRQTDNFLTSAVGKPSR